jgi:hypothetical protein
VLLLSYKINKAVTPTKNEPPPIKKKGKLIISHSAKWYKVMRFEELFITMHCDFFEVHKNGKIERIEYEGSGKMFTASKKYFDDVVKDFYIIRAKNSNDLGLMVRL